MYLNATSIVCNRAWVRVGEGERLSQEWWSRGASNTRPPPPHPDIDCPRWERAGRNERAGCNHCPKCPTVPNSRNCVAQDYIFWSSNLIICEVGKHILKSYLKMCVHKWISASNINVHQLIWQKFGFCNDKSQLFRFTKKFEPSK